MPTSFIVRRLTAGPTTSDPNTNYLDVGAELDSVDGAVHQVNSQDLRLSSDDVVRLLERRELNSTDLVVVDGTWTTLADSMPFSEAAEPYARKERRVRNLKSAFVLFVSLLGAFGGAVLYFLSGVLHH